MDRLFILDYRRSHGSVLRFVSESSGPSSKSGLDVLPPCFVRSLLQNDRDLLDSISIRRAWIMKHDPSFAIFHEMLNVVGLSQNRTIHPVLSALVVNQHMTSVLLREQTPTEEIP